MAEDKLFDPYTASSDRVINVESWMALDQDARGEVVRVIGRPSPVAITDVRVYPSGSLKLVTLDASERSWLTGLLSTGRIIGFRPADPSYGLDNPTYLYVGRVTQQRFVRRARAAERLWTLEVQIVDAPVV